jgi:DNA-binding CsgD family transcriptional regulator
MVAIAKQVVTLSTLSEPEHLPPPAVLLTKQELKLLCALGSGMAPEALAFKFRITPHTLRNHIHHINEKLGTHSRLEAVVEAMRRGLI